MINLMPSSSRRGAARRIEVGPKLISQLDQGVLQPLRPPPHQHRELPEPFLAVGGYGVIVFGRPSPHIHVDATLYVTVALELVQDVVDPLELEGPLEPLVQAVADAVTVAVFAGGDLSQNVEIKFIGIHRLDLLSR